jgi:dephospho-CoA kinase
MRLIGLVGGIASGKSLVAQQLRSLGAEVLDADRVGHEILRLPEIVAAIRGHFGDRVFDADGHVDRKALGPVVFGPPPDGPRQLATLESITHPEIRRRLRIQAEEMAERGVPLVVLDAPVLLKAGWDQMCDALVFIDSPRDLRLSRALKRGWTAEEFAAREAAQEPIEEKRRRAGFVVDNSGDLGYTLGQVERLWRLLVG